MIRDRKARMKITGEIVHAALGIPADIEVLDFEIELRGPGLPDDYIDVEGNNPPYADWFWKPTSGSST